MNVWINSLVFGWYPYVSLSVFLLGGWLRFDGTHHWQRESPSRLWSFGPLASGGTLFHAGILTLLVGHLVGLLTPIEAFEAIGISHGLKQTMANVIGGAAGGIALVGLALMVRHGRSGARERLRRSLADVAILLLIMIQLGLGLGTIAYAVAEYPSGCGALPFMWWAQSIVALKPGGGRLRSRNPAHFQAAYDQWHDDHAGLAVHSAREHLGHTGFDCRSRQDAAAIPTHIQIKRRSIRLNEIGALLRPRPKAALLVDGGALSLISRAVAVTAVEPLMSELRGAGNGAHLFGINPKIRPNSQMHQLDNAWR